MSEFDTSKEFEQTYFWSLVKPRTDKKKPINPIENFNPDQVKLISSAKLCTEDPFPGDLLILELSPDFKVQKSNLTSGRVFGDDLSRTFEGQPEFFNFLRPEFLEEAQTYLNQLKEKPKESLKLYTAIKAPNDQVWIAELEHTQPKEGSANDTISITIRNRTQETSRVLNKDSEPKKEKEKEEGHPHVDLIIFGINSILGSSSLDWVTKTATLLKKAHLWPEENRPRFIVTRYEEDAKEKSNFSHPFIDDMLCLPFDRLIFLQKVEVALALPKKTSPSFLFVQEANESIEIAKRVVIEKFSDMGFAMSNPAPLLPGTPAHFYFQYPGQTPLQDIDAKVTLSLPHPEKDDEHLVFFHFFGLKKERLKDVRAYLGRDSGYKSVLNPNTDEFAYNPDNIFISEEDKKQKTVVVIDPEEKSCQSTTETINDQLGNVRTVSDTSFYMFFKNYVSKEAESDKAPPSTPDDFFKNPISLLINLEDERIQMPLTPPNDEDLLFGYEAKALFSDPQGWLKLFQNEISRKILTESLRLIKSTNRAQKLIEVTTQDGSLKNTACEFILEDGGLSFRINISPPDSKTLLGKKIEPLASLEALVIDYHLLPENIDAFMTGLKDSLDKEGIPSPKEGPALIVTTEDSKFVKTKGLMSSRAFALLYKPVETRRLSYLISQAIGSPFTINSFENIGWKTDKVPAKLARPAQVVEFSEFGATVKLSKKLKLGSMFYLFKSIYSNAPGQNLCCRVYSSEENDAEKGTFLNHMVYFGITDNFLKFIRSYIREAYASKKESEGQN